MRSTLLPRLLVAACVFAGLASLFPAQAWHWDEFQLAYAIGDFDLSRHQPHPPGYYLFVVAGRAVDALLGDPFLALRCVSALAVAVAAALSLGGAQPGAQRSAWALLLVSAGSFALASPLTQRFGVAALSYAAEGAIWLAWLLAFGGRANGSGLKRLAFVAGLAGGVRQTLALWAAFLLLIEMFRRRDGRELAAVALAGAAGVAVWFVPLLWEAGGWGAYRAAVGALATGNVWAKSVFVSGFALWPERLTAMALDLLAGLGGMSFVLATALVWRARGRVAADPARDTLLAGAALAFSFYALVIYDSPGYLMAVLLPLAAWSLRVVAVALAGWPAQRQVVVAGCVLLLAVATAITPRERIEIDSAAQTERLDARFSPVRASFDPRTTVLVTSREYWDYALRHVAHALPEFAVLQLAHDPYFAIVDDAHPYLASRRGQVDAVGPDPLDLATLTPDAGLASVVYMVPFDADDFVAPACGALAHALETKTGERLPVLELETGWRIEARGQRLHCVAADTTGSPD